MHYHLHVLLVLQAIGPSALAAIACVVVSIGCHHSGAQDQRITGPESKDIATRVSGYVIRTKSFSELIALSLPEMKETLIHKVVSKDAEVYPTIHALSGPDSKGRIAYIEDYFFTPNEKDRRHLLKTIQVDGTGETELFSRPGNAMWATSAIGRGEIGKYLALAPSGGKVAFLSGISDKQMPRALLNEGNIEIWDIDKKLRHDVTARGINQPMSWFPDGKRLAFVRLVARSELPKPAVGLEKFGRYFDQSWDAVPAIYILNVESSQISFLHVGWTPVVSSDGDSLLVGGWDDRSGFSWNLFKPGSQESSPVQWPGYAGDAAALVEDNIVLYKGMEIADDRVTSETDPKRAAPLQLAMMGSNKFQVVVPKVNPRDLVSFGKLLKQD